MTTEMFQLSHFQDTTYPEYHIFCRVCETPRHHLTSTIAHDPPVILPSQQLSLHTVLCLIPSLQKILYILVFPLQSATQPPVSDY